MNIWEYFASFDEAFRELNFFREERIDNDVELLVQLIRNENG